MKKYILSLLFINFLFWSCDGQQIAVKKLEPKDFIAQINQDSNVQILDVRTPEEFSNEHIDHAININWNDAQFQTQVERLDKNKPIYIYCLSGGRSAKAASKLADLGFANIFEMKGGMVKYTSEGLSKSTATNQGMTIDDYQNNIQSTKKVLVNFNAKWCAPCKKMAPFIATMKKETTPNDAILLIDADENKSLLKQLNIAEIPTMHIYQKGKLVWTHVGFISENDLRKEFDKY